MDSKLLAPSLLSSELGWGRDRTGVHGFAGRCITTLPPSQEIWSGKRDSNSRPQPWQGCALPTELFPHTIPQMPWYS